MGISCIFLGHKWNGCKCVRCGAIRNEQHDWDMCKGVCKQCGKTRPEQHDWKGCKCVRCGKKRDEQHYWDSYLCSYCGKRLADVDIQDEYGETALFRSIKNRNIKGVKSLLEHGANSNHKNNNGNTPLICACYTGLFNSSETSIYDIRLIISILLESDADVSAKNNQGETAFDIMDVGYGSFENKQLMKEILLADKAKRKELLETDKTKVAKLKAYAAEKEKMKKRHEALLPRCPKCGGAMDSQEGIYRSKGTVESWARCRKCDYRRLNYKRPIQDGDITT